MMLSGRAFALLGFVGSLNVVAFVAPVLGWTALAIDVVVLVLVAVDATAAARLAPAVRRSIPETLHQGETASVRLDLVNSRNRTIEVRVRECLADELLDTPRDFSVRIPPRSTGRVTYDLVPRWRGDARLAPAALRLLGPMRLAWRGVDGRDESGSVDRVRVYPRVHFGGRTALVLRQAMERRVGANPLSSRGISTETYSLREYQSGDEYRRIHWKQSARLRRPIVRETIWEQHQQVVVMLDCGRPMSSMAGEHSKLDLALAAVLALMRVAVSQRDDVTLVLFAEEILGVIRVDKRTRSFHSVFERVYRQAAGFGEPDYVGAAGWCSRAVPRRSLALLCTSVIDLVGAEQVGRALGSLALRHKPLLVNLEDPGLMHHDRVVPGDEREGFAKVSAMSIVEENHALALRLRSRGVDVLGSPASELTMSMVQRFLDLKARRAF